MKTRALASLIATVLVVFCLGCAGPAQTVAPLNWETSLPKAIATAQSTARPILVVVGATWCPSCRRLKAETLDHRASRAQLDGFVLLSVDVDESPALAERFGTGLLPTLVILDRDGTVLLANVGYQERVEFARFLEQGEALASAGGARVLDAAGMP